MTRDFRLLLLATAGAFATYAPMLAVVPLWSAAGGSSEFGAGATTGSAMAATVAVQLCMGLLLPRFGARRLLAAGSLLLGLPTAAYPLSAALPWVLAVSAVRGVGFGLVAVAGSALAADLAPPGRRASAIGWYGAAAGLPHVLCLPLGLWCAQRFGFPAVFLVAAASAVLAAPLAAAIAERPRGGTGPAGGTARVPGTPLLLMLLVAGALGGVTSFLALVLPAPGAAPAVLLALSTAMVLGRLAAGAVADRIGDGRLLAPAVALAALGTGGIATGSVVPATVAGVLLGAGFGALQNETLVVLFARAGRAGRGRASTAWNMAYDAGTGAGALVVGALSRLLGLGGSLALAAVLVAAATPLAWAESRRTGPLPVTPPW
ncbi:MFS transporter [Streptacidiphilus griseoplanus]|uniref:MFS transporter n=1 Tax=Peterkaempfera griseoplana TaxID=66896 RepID=UPI0006E43137|nr:MFS transporter [Peterkaempfera griseoplana]